MKIRLWSGAFAAILLLFAALLLNGCGGGSDGGSSVGGGTGTTGGGGTTSGGTTTGVTTTTSGGTTGGGTGKVVDQPNWTVRSQTVVQPTRKWTVLVYMNGANNLEPYAVLNVNQMESVGSTADVNMVVQFKRIAGKYDSSNGDWSDTRRYFITKDGVNNTINSTLLSQRDNVDMGSANTLQEFVRWGIATYPAQKYALVMWNHGAGWRAQKIPGRSAIPGRGVSYDDVTGNHIDTIQFPAAMNIDRPWDLLVWDSSLMQMAEVAYEVRNTAKYMVGSEESPPGTGYPYDLFLARLVANPDMDAKTLGTYIVDDTVFAYGDANYSNLWSVGNSNGITQSLIDLSQMNTVANAVNTFGGSLSAAKTNYGQQIADARNASDRYDYQENHDLLDFCKYLQTTVPDTGVQNSINTVRNVLAAAIVHHGERSDHASSNGMAIFLPSPSDYRYIDISQANGFGQRYSALSWTKAVPNWQSFLVNGTD